MHDDVTLTCTATGVPTPTITWYKDSTAISHDLEKFNISTDGSMLTIHNVTHTESGNYFCLTANEAGKDSRQFSLFVIGMYRMFHNMVEINGSSIVK